MGLLIARLASLACSSLIDELWIDETHVIIQDVLYENKCNCHRGLGTMSPSMANPIININIMGTLL